MKDYLDSTSYMDSLLKRNEYCYEKLTQKDEKKYPSILDRIKDRITYMNTLRNPSALYLGSLEMNQLKAQAAELCTFDSLSDISTFDGLTVYEVNCESHLGVA